MSAIMRVRLHFRSIRAVFDDDDDQEEKEDKWSRLVLCSALPFFLFNVDVDVDVDVEAEQSRD